VPRIRQGGGHGRSIGFLCDSKSLTFENVAQRLVAVLRVFLSNPIHKETCFYFVVANSVMRVDWFVLRVLIVGFHDVDDRFPRNVHLHTASNVAWCG